MSRVRLNNEYRQKFFNRIKSTFEDEDTQEREAFLQSREDVNEAYEKVFPLMKEVVQRSNPPEDVKILRTFKKKYGSVCDVVAKDKCFYFAYTDKNKKDVDEDVVEDQETKSHFDLGLYGSLNGNDSYHNSDDNKAFAYAYFREELKAKGCNPDIVAQMKDKDDNPHKTKHMDLNDKALGYSGYSSYNSDSDNNNGMTKNFDSQWNVDIVGTSHCRQRAVACSQKEYEIFMGWRSQKGMLVAKHQTWISSLNAQYQKVKEGLKAYRYMEEAIKFCQELGIQVDEAEMVRSNSTGLMIYEPTNLASLIKGMKNKTQTREQKIVERLKYDQQQSVN